MPLKKSVQLRKQSGKSCSYFVPMPNGKGSIYLELIVLASGISSLI